MRAVLLSCVVAGVAGCHSSSAGSSGGPTDYPSPCPTEAPAPGSACKDDGLACEYGNDSNIACDSVYACASGAWGASGSSDAGLACDPSVGSACQPTYDMQKSVATTGSCAPSGLVCSYAQGTCGCVPPSGVPVLDGGPVTQAAKWICVDLPSGCPFPRPRLGDGCVTVDEQCDYAGCWGGISLGCTSGHTWASAPTTCPQ